MPTFDEIAEFVRAETGFHGEVSEGTSLQEDICIYGDDIDHLIVEFAERFNVDVSRYLWYFHTGEEGWNIGGIFFRPPNAKVRAIPITVGMLHEFAEEGRWDIKYPDHEPPGFRLDMLVNWCILALVLVLGLLGSRAP